VLNVVIANLLIMELHAIGANFIELLQQSSWKSSVQSKVHAVRFTLHSTRKKLFHIITRTYL